MSRRGKRSTKTKSVVLQLLIAMPILTVLLALLGAKLILSSVIAESQIGVVVFMIAMLVSLVGSWYAAMRMSQKRFFWGLSFTGCYGLLLLLSNLLFFGVAYTSVGAVLCAVACGGLTGSLLGAAKRKKYA